MSVSALYFGTVVHTRMRPVRHRLRYRMLMLLLDLDEVPVLSRQLRLFSAERFNLFGFAERDHLAPGGGTLRVQVEAALSAAGIALDGGPIRLLAMPRVLGSVFNPLSIFFCHGRDGALRAVLYEVNNTFGQRHSYLIPVDQPGLPIRQECVKDFYVSPFMDMALRYRFRLIPPGETLGVAIEVRDETGPVLTAGLAARREALTDGALLRGFLRHPLLAAQVLGGIHWEAAKLWRKGMRVRPRPAPPAEPVTVVRLAEPVSIVPPGRVV